jgi:S-layer homology domain
MRKPASLAIRLCILAACALAPGAPAIAQSNHLPVRTSSSIPAPPAPSKSLPRDYGTSHLTYVQVAAAAFTPLDSSTTWTTTHSGYFDQVLRTATGSFVDFAASLNLPNGALIEYLELDECDGTGGSGYVQGALVQSDYIGNSDATGFLASDGTGCRFLSEDVTSKGFVVDNYHKHYWLVATVSSSPDGPTGLAGIVVGYQLQVSPAPGSATFGDVPTNYIYFRAIEALAASKITSGCGGGNFCPNQAVTRGELAKFLANALGLFWPAGP